MEKVKKWLLMIYLKLKYVILSVILFVTVNLDDILVLLSLALFNLGVYEVLKYYGLSVFYMLVLSITIMVMVFIRRLNDKEV